MLFRNHRYISSPRKRWINVNIHSSHALINRPWHLRRRPSFIFSIASFSPFDVFFFILQLFNLRFKSFLFACWVQLLSPYAKVAVGGALLLNRIAIWRKLSKHLFPLQIGNVLVTQLLKVYFHLILWLNYFFCCSFGFFSRRSKCCNDCLGLFGFYK